MNIQSKLRREINRKLNTIRMNRKTANSTTNSKLWSRVMHRLKALRAELRALCVELKEFLYGEKAVFKIHGKNQECIMIAFNQSPDSVDLRSTVTGEYFRSFNYNKEILSLGFTY